MVPYPARFWAISVLMSAAYTTVALSDRLSVQLLGVVFSSLQARNYLIFTSHTKGILRTLYVLWLQGGLGEASCLAMCTYFDSKRVITFWSSGTGFAGLW